jgi:hypothetical protein
LDLPLEKLSREQILLIILSINQDALSPCLLVRIPLFFSNSPAVVIPCLLVVFYLPATRLLPNFLITFSFSSALAPETAGNSFIHS